MYAIMRAAGKSWHVRCIMAKIRLVIAEKDEGYVEKLVDYLMTNHLGKFTLKYFTDPNAFKEFLADSLEPIDILLACPKMYKISSAGVAISKVKTLIMLSQGMGSKETDGIKTIEKYQRADRIVSEMLDKFLLCQDSEVLLPKNTRHTRTIAVYSPQGGTGKTTLAVGLCAELSRQGMPAFYLNMEDIQSTEAFFDCEGASGLSDIFFYLKEQGNNISLKIESVKSTDLSKKIQYFAPPNGITEIDDMTPNELCDLVFRIKQMAHYDFIVIDMSSSFNARNIALLGVCEHRTQFSMRSIEFFKEGLMKYLQNIA